jgi:predicted PurR-regulated permease PerM
MDKLVHADIFFFITTCAIVLLTIIFAIALVYGIFIAKNLHYIVKKIKEESDNISGDIAHARQKIREQGIKMASYVEFLKSLVSFGSAKKSKKKSSKKTEDSEDTN